MNPNLDELQQLIGIKFNDPAILNQALIHRSYLNENKSSGPKDSNERFEFLGDAVLELWSSETLFRLFPDYPEGKLTNLRSLVVCTENLALVAASFNLGKFVLLSRGEETHQGRENISILADTLESLIGAIYLDNSIDQVNKFLDQFLLPGLNNISQQKIYKDPKSLFQEIAQAKQGITPRYITITESGPDHHKNFTVGVYLNDKLIAEGEGNSKLKAESAAALAGYQKLNK